MVTRKPRGGTSRGPVSALKLPANVRSITASADLTTPAQSAVTRVRLGVPLKPEGMPPSLAALWDEIAPDLDAAGLLSPVDAITLEFALSHAVVARKARNALLRSTVSMHDDKNDREMKHPASQVMRDHSASYLEYAKQLGMSFAARTRLPGRDEIVDDVNPYAVGQ